MFIRLDEWIMSKYQTGYDYLWDNYGLTKGLLCLSLYLIMVTSKVSKDMYDPSFFTYLIILFSLVVIYSAHLMHTYQKKGNYSIVNTYTMLVKNSPIATATRWAAIFIYFLSIISNILLFFIDIGSIYNLFLSIVGFSFSFTVYLMITERNVAYKLNASYNSI